MEKTLAQLALDAIVTRSEFRLLHNYHKELFKKDLTMYYINYSLDYYNNNYKPGASIETIKDALVETMEEMYNDYLIVDSFKST